jgi:hypothetical protein
MPHEPQEDTAACTNAVRAFGAAQFVILQYVSGQSTTPHA